MRIDSSGNVGIGQTSPRNDTSTTTLHIGNSSIGTAQLVLQDNDADWRIKSNESLIINDGTAERMRIDSSGNVGIGGTTTTGWANKQVVLDAGANTSAAFVMVNDTTGRTGTDGSVITLSGSDMYLIQRESANMIFRTANTERMRIDSSGNLLVGTDESNPTSSTVNVAGQAFSTTGGVRSTVASNPAATFNRKADDGAVVIFRKDGSTVGSIGVVSSDRMYFATADGLGLQFDKDNNRIVPCDAAGAYNSNVELGDENLAFTNLFLTGGIQFDSRSNKLDDYEEGTYIPTWDTVTGNPVSYRNADNANNTSTNGLSYVKIGRQVTITGMAVFASGSSINSQRPNMTLPFTAQLYSVTGVISSYATGSEQSVNYLNYNATNKINFFKLDSAGSHIAFGTNGAIELYFDITYITI
jgi:hypothetical protein